MASNRQNLMIIPGDGIGPEIMREATRVVEWFADKRGLGIDVRHGELGVATYKKHGVMVTEETLSDMAAADAILFGAAGDADTPIPTEVRRRSGLLYVRKTLGLFACLRPIVVFDALANSTTLKAEVVRGVDMIILRELNGGLYFGEPRGYEDLGNGERRGYNTMSYTTAETRRVAEVAFELARSRRGKLASVDKANVLEASVVWRDEVTRLGRDVYPDVEVSHFYVDNAAMQLVRRPSQFDVMVTENTFGDILSDTAGMVAGSLGMLPSASFSARDDDGSRNALYEPIHGSAPDIAGKNIANPIGTILSFGMALRHTYNRPEDADLLQNAIEAALAKGVRTPDIAAGAANAVSTDKMGDAILAALEDVAG